MSLPLLRMPSPCRCLLPGPVSQGPGEVIWAEIFDSTRSNTGIVINYMRVTTRLQIFELGRATLYVASTISTFRQIPAGRLRRGAD